jgi:hypothetical protein
MARATANRFTREAVSSSGADRLIHVRLPGDLHRSLRIHVAANDTSIQDWVAALIARELGSLTENAREEGRRK